MGREASDDVCPAGRVLAGRRGTAREYFPAAGRVRHARHVERTRDAEIAQVRQRRDTKRIADLGIGQRVLDRRHEIVDRTVEPLDERRRHVLRPRLDMDAGRRQIETLLAGFGHPIIDVEQRDPLTVDRHFNLLASRRAAIELTGGHSVKHDAEGVLAVGGEGVNHGDAATGAPGSPFDVVHLRLGPRHLVSSFGRAGRPIAQGEAGDFAGRAQIALHQRRRERLRVRDVIEALADRVGWKERVDVDVESEQIVNRAGILGAIEPLEGSPAWIRRGKGGLVDS